jgi:6,7-dimethyl-8-ribityllumazine synthase
MRRKLAVVVAEFNQRLVDAMVRSAEAEAEQHGAVIVDIVRVPGSYETPLAAEALLQRRDVDALVVLGYIERGETLHGEVMGHVVHRALLDASLRHRKPVGFGFIGPGALPRQAEKRKDEYARAAVRAAVRMLEVLQAITPRGRKVAPRRRRR